MKKIGRYEIVGRLGQGGMSSVYKARAPITGRIVALKLLQPRNEIFGELVGEEGLKELFLEEAKIMGRISHEHVARIVDCDVAEGAPYIVLEYYARSLGSIIGESYDVEQASRILSERKSIYYTRQTLRGLERLHFASIIHRDIKPYNLMLTNEDCIKVIDFGLSRVRGEEKLSIPGMQVGSPHYSAPEQIKSPKLADARSDLFSVGVMLYRMLTGRLPVWENGALVLPCTVNTQLTSVWDGFCEQVLAKNPDNRFAGAKEMIAELESIGRSLCENGGGLTKYGARKAAEGIELRSEPVRIMYKDIRKSLQLDMLMRPIKYQENTFEMIDGELACQKNTGLYWQRKGAGFGVDWQQAKTYVEELNNNAWKGRSNWRLPTTMELASVLLPPGHGHTGCVGRDNDNFLFPRAIPWLWSADHCTKKQAWCADVGESFIERLAMDGTAYVCAISG